MLSEARTRQNFVTASGLRLNSKISLHVRQKTDHANVLPRLPQLFNRRDGLAPRVQVHDDQFWLAGHESHQGLAIHRHFHFHANLLRGVRQLHLEEKSRETSRGSGTVPEATSGCQSRLKSQVEISRQKIRSVPAAGLVRANSFIRDCAFAPFDAVVNAKLADGTEGLVVKRWN